MKRTAIMTIEVTVIDDNSKTKEEHMEPTHTYVIRLSGCDDETEFKMCLTNSEYELLKKVAEKSQETSTYICMPKMFVEGIDIPDMKPTCRV